METMLDKSNTTPTTGVNTVHLGMVGFGTVGTGVYKVLERHPELVFEKIAVRDTQKARQVEGLNADLITADPFEVVRDASVQVVIEVMGGVDIAKNLITEALQNGKHVITANKELIAKHGAELLALANKKNVRLLFEGAVAGGIPIIMPLKLSLAANQVEVMAGILNGTTNYILTKMSQEGWDFETALKTAQEKGFAEADPTNDVDGFDAAYKIAILSSIAFNQSVNPEDVHCEGIRSITAEDIQTADKLGYVIKLIALAKKSADSNPDIRVHPMLVSKHHPLANVENEYNALWVLGDAVGDVMFYGKGAGELPTASAVCADILAVCRGLLKGNDPIPSMTFEYQGSTPLSSIENTTNRYYIQVNTADTPGVIGNLGQACGKHGVSLDSVMQQGTHADGNACIVLLTHEVTEGEMQAALKDIEAQPTTQSIGAMIRVL
ncbi:MAG: homoserine dehydrogenase [Vampirovibrio sp.]|nr:homoserine dehydrogenase [Vampirovibrio sp.]